MFRAIGRYMKALGYLVTGRIDKARNALSANPVVVRATYDQIIRDKTESVREYRRAVAGLVTQQEKKRSQLHKLTSEVEKLENLRAGALAKAKKRSEQLQKAGKSLEEIHADGDYLKCKTAFADFTSTLAEKQARIAELEADVEDYSGKIANHKIQLTQLLRDLDKLKMEAEETVADMVTAREEKEIADMLTGISQDGTAKELEDMRNVRARAKAEARIASELAGTDSKAQEAEFLAYARDNEANSEFDSLIGLAEKANAAPKTPAAADKEQLPQ